MYFQEHSGRQDRFERSCRPEQSFITRYKQNTMEALYIIGPILALVLFWFTLMSIFYRFGGWYKVSEKYRHLSPVDGEAVNWTSIVINKGARYQRSMHMVVSNKGLYVAPVKLFQIVWHKPILIPWRDVTSVEEGRHLAATYYTLTLKDGTELGVGYKIKEAMDKVGVSIG